MIIFVQVIRLNEGVRKLMCAKNPYFFRRRTMSEIDLGGKSGNVSNGEFRGKNEPNDTDLLKVQNDELDKTVKAALSGKIEHALSLELPKLSSYIGVSFDESVKANIRALGYDDSLVSIGSPTKRNDLTKNVDFAFNVAAAAKDAGKNPLEVAQEIVAKLSEDELVEEAYAVGPFVNIEFNFGTFASQVFTEVVEHGEHYGHFRDGTPELVIVDYSSPNVAKNMTVAHLRSTIIGHSLTKIHEATGNIVFGINHIGDWGTQFGKIVYEYKRELLEKGDDFQAEIDDNPSATLLRLYRNFKAREVNDPEAVRSAQAIFLELENGDPELIELWMQFREWSLQDFGPVYNRLRVDFDAIQGESFYEDKMAGTVADALNKGTLKTNEEGSVVFPSQILTNPTTHETNEQMMLDQNGQPRDELILKPSGGTVYLTRDLAGIKYRSEELGADRILYVIGKEQLPHCLKLFAMADQQGYIKMGAAEHVSFGHLNIDGKKMASSGGEIKLLDETLDEAVAAAESMLKLRKQEAGDQSNLTTVELHAAQQIGIGAIIFNDLKQNREKDIKFNRDTAKTLEAGSSAYIQYTNSRLSGILEKTDGPTELVAIPKELSPSEKRIIAQVARLPQIIQEAADKNAPHKIATYLTELCQTVNLFYQEGSIINATNETDRNFKLHIVRTAQQVIKNASNLLHLELPDKM